MSDDAVADRLADYARSLETAEPGSGIDDLRPLTEYVAGKTVVGLGEATHGSREFFQLKHRLLELLVTELDYRLIGLEAPFSATVAVNDYVVHGEGQSAAALSAVGHWMFETESMRALLAWLREFNADRPVEDRVRVYGIDAPYTAGPAQVVSAFLDRVDPDYSEAIDEELAILRAGIRDLPDDELDEAVVATEGIAEAIRERFADRREAYVAATSEHEWAIADRHAWALDRARRTAAINHHSEDAFAGAAIRERTMAESVSWLLDYEDRDRIAVWAHNGHVGRGDWEWGTEDAMGQHLADRYGEDYYAVGFDFGRGSFGAYPGGDGCLQEWTVETVPDDSVAGAFDAVEAPACLLDFADARTDPRLTAWLEREHARHSVGSVVPEERALTTEDVPAERFDALIVVPETSRAVPIDRDDG